MITLLLKPARNFPQTVRNTQHWIYHNPGYKIIFHTPVDLYFSRQEIKQIEIDSAHKHIHITNYRLNILGSQGAMPLSYTEEALQQEKQKNKAVTRFVDIFQHRFMKLDYFSEQNSNVIMDYEKIKYNTKNKSFFCNRLSDLIGTSYEIDDCKLTFGAYFIDQVRSATHLSQIIRALCGYPTSIIPFVYLEKTLTNEHKVQLGCRHSQLGKNFMIGEKVRMDQFNFDIKIEVDNYEHYVQLCLNNVIQQRIRNIVSSFLNTNYQFRLSITLAAAQKTSTYLDSIKNNRSPYLGVNFFLITGVSHFSKLI